MVQSAGRRGGSEPVRYSPVDALADGLETLIVPCGSLARYNTSQSGSGSVTAGQQGIRVETSSTDTGSADAYHDASAPIDWGGARWLLEAHARFRAPTPDDLNGLFIEAGGVDIIGVSVTTSGELIGRLTIQDGFDSTTYETAPIATLNASEARATIVLDVRPSESETVFTLRLGDGVAASETLSQVPGEKAGSRALGIGTNTAAAVSSRVQLNSARFVWPDGVPRPQNDGGR